jgi:hypothetical protein
MKLSQLTVAFAALLSTAVAQIDDLPNCAVCFYPLLRACLQSTDKVTERLSHGRLSRQLWS